MRALGTGLPSLDEIASRSIPTVKHVPVRARGLWAQTGADQMHCGGSVREYHGGLDGIGHVTENGS